MTALVMTYALAVGLPLAGIGLLLDRMASYRRAPRRWIWAAIAALEVALVAAAPWRALLARPVEIAPPSTVASSHESPAALPDVASPATPSSSWRDAAGAWARDAVAWIVRWDRAAGWLWLVTSAAAALVFGLGYVMLSVRQRRWRAALVCGIPVLVSASEGPAVVGIRTPHIVLPDWALALDPAALDLMLRHEREHLAAGDPRLVHLAGLALLAMPWNPVVWWVLSRLRLAVELDCDARVLGAGARAPDVVAPEAPLYGELLLTVVSHRSSRRAFTAPAMLETPSTLSRRITAMYPQRLRLTGLRAGVAGATAVALAVAVFVMPAPRASAQSKEGATTASKHLGGAATAPAFHAPSAAAAKALVAKHAPDVLRQDTQGVTAETREGRVTAFKNIAVVLIQNESGQVTGTTSMSVLERVMAVVNPEPPKAPVTEAQAREARLREERQQEEREKRVERPDPRTPEEQARDEARARAERAEADRQAADLSGRLISIDLVRYAAGELGPEPVSVYFLTTRGNGGRVR